MDNIIVFILSSLYLLHAITVIDLPLKWELSLCQIKIEVKRVRKLYYYNARAMKLKVTSIILFMSPLATMLGALELLLSVKTEAWFPLEK